MARYLHRRRSVGFNQTRLYDVRRSTHFSLSSCYRLPSGRGHLRAPLLGNGLFGVVDIALVSAMAYLYVERCMDVSCMLLFSVIIDHILTAFD